MPAPVLQFKRGAYNNLPGLRAGEPGFTTDKQDLFVGLTSSLSTNQFFGSGRYWGREDGTNSLRLKLVDKDGTNGIKIKTQNVVSTGTTDTYTLPNTDTIQNGYFLRVDSNGNLSWQTVTESGSFSNVSISTASFTGITTFQNTAFLDVNSNADFSGITTFSNTDDNTLGDSNTGAVQLNGGLGVDKNVTVGGNLNVQGYSEFVGVATFKGGVINLGDQNTDTITVGGRFSSNLVPSQDNAYDVGISTLNWRNAYFSGIGTFESGAVIDGVQIGINGANVIDTVSGNLTLNSAGGTTIIDDAVTIQNNLTVTGNVTIGGTTVTLVGQDVYISNKDIVLGFTTDANNNDVSTDSTANHAGVAIASTVGTPLVSFSASGINTLPDTYKQMMWFQKNTLGFATDVFAFNYGVAIGTTNVADGTRLAVGSDIRMTDDSIGIGTATPTSSLWVGGDGYFTGVVTSSNFYVGNVLVGSGGFFADLNVTGISTFQGNVNLGNGPEDAIIVSGIATFNQSITGTISTATRATTVDTVDAGNSSGKYHVTFVNSNNGSASPETVYTDDGIYYDPGANRFTTQHAHFTGNVVVGLGLSIAGISTFTDLLYANGGIDVTGHAELDEVNVSGATTVTSLNATGNVTLGDTSGDTITIKGTPTFEQPIVGTIGTATRATQVDTTGTSTNADYFVTFVDTFAGQLSETLRVGAGLSVNPSDGSVKTDGILSVGKNVNLTSYIKSGGGSNALYIYDNGDVSFQQGLQGLSARFTQNLNVTGIATVGTSLSTPTVRTNYIRSSDTNDIAITISGDDVTIAGDLIVQGNTTQLNTSSMTVEDRTIELGVVDNAVPSSQTTWDLGVLFNYHDGVSAKKSGVIWEQDDQTGNTSGRFVFGSVVSDGGGTGNNSPQITFTTYAPIEVAELWVNNTCTGGSSQVIACSGTELVLQNITVDAGSF